MSIMLEYYYKKPYSWISLTYNEQFNYQQQLLELN